MCRYMGTKTLFGHCLGGMLDTQFLHFRLEGGSFQTENLGGSARSGKAPTGLFQHGQQMRSFHIVEVIRGVGLRG